MFKQFLISFPNPEKAFTTKITSIIMQVRKHD